jgi:hypothetical protein
VATFEFTNNSVVSHPMLNETEKITVEIIQRHFELHEISLEEEGMKKIREILIDKLDFLLDHHFEKLLQILYRIDVPEEKAKTALSEKSDRKPSEILADLIIERQSEKARTRIEYQKKKDSE